MNEFIVDFDVNLNPYNMLKKNTNLKLHNQN
jgi:hypothetical protein